MLCIIIYKAWFIYDVSLFLRKNFIVKFREYYFIFYFFGDLYNMSILKILIVVIVNNFDGVN